MKIKETYIAPEISLAEIKENLLDIDPSGIDNVSVDFASAKRRDLLDSDLGGFFINYL
ncbi:MAG: hypothetical protein J1F17_06590 [Oscillospiraceae bacterium]|nr:hypothetical protein [Oscillospiraceae bacterium]